MRKTTQTKNHKRARELASRLVYPDQKQAFKNLTALIEQTLELKQSQAVLAFNDFLAMLNNEGVFSYDKCCEYMKEFQQKIQ